MAKNPARTAQQKLYDAMHEGATVDGIRAARKEAKAAWESATPAERAEALADKRPLKRR